MVGPWKNIAELEESINMLELHMIINHKRKREDEDRKFQAALQGHDLDKAKGSAKAREEEVRRRAAIRVAGSEAALEKEELQALGFNFG